jgi:outer membrane protein assembly factor BamB
MLRGIRVADGKEVFELSSGAYTGASPVIVDGHAYYGTYENEVLGVDLKARKIVWTYKHPTRNFPFYSSAALADTRLILGGRDKIVHALDRRSGKSLWTFDTRARVDSSPVVAGGRAYIGSNDGKLYVLDVASGKSVFEFDAGGPLSASPAVASGRVVIGSQDGTLFCLG